MLNEGGAEVLYASRTSVAGRHLTMTCDRDDFTHMAPLEAAKAGD